MRDAVWGKGWIRRATPLALLAGLTACAAPTSYMGIAFNSDAVDPELRTLVTLARSGDKQAQLELGIRFEEGRGVPVDRNRAIALYRLAATDSGGPLWVWVPAMGNVPGRVMSVGQGPRVNGIGEAEARLQKLAAEE